MMWGSVFAYVGHDPVEHVKHAKQTTTRYAGVYKKLYKTHHSNIK